MKIIKIFIRIMKTIKYFNFNSYLVVTTLYDVVTISLMWQKVTTVANNSYVNCRVL